MAITANWYGQATVGQYSSTAARQVKWVADAINVALCTVSYVPDPDNHVFFSSVTNELATAGGYVAGGLALSGKSVGYLSASNDAVLIAAPSVWSSATFGPCQIAVVYSTAGGSAATNPLLGWVDFGGPQTVSSGTFTITWDATNGVLRARA